MGLEELVSSRLLLVEGKDDKEFFNHIRNSLRLQDTELQTISYDGKDQLRAKVKALTVLPNFRSVHVLAVVRDADDDAASAFRSVQGCLEQLVEIPPDAPNKFGRSKMTNLPQFGNRSLWTGAVILPGESRPGEMEDLLLEAMRDRDEPAMACVDEYIACLEGKGVELKKPAKTRLQAFLASCEKAETGLWKACLKDHVPMDSPRFSMIRSFLEEMGKLKAP